MTPTDFVGSQLPDDEDRDGLETVTQLIAGEYFIE
jgi:hypothetical protein